MVRITCFLLIIVPILVRGFSINNPNFIRGFGKQPNANSFHVALRNSLFNEDDLPELKNDAEDGDDYRDHGSNGDPDSDVEMINGVLCQKCEPGTGLVSMCNSTHSTVCEPCASGVNYSHEEFHFRPCTPCSQCGVNMYVEAECTAERDTFCDWCRSSLFDRDSEETRIQIHNEDFWLKCQGTWTEKNVIVEDEGSLPDPPVAVDDDDLKQTLDDDTNSLEKPSLLSVDEINKLNREIEQELDLEGDIERELVSEATDSSFVEVPPPRLGEKLTFDSNFFGEEDETTTSVINPVVTTDMNYDDRLQKMSLTTFSIPAKDDTYSDIVFKPSVHEYPYDELVHASSESIFSQVKMGVVAHRYWIASAACLLMVVLAVLIALKCRKRNDVKFMIATLTEDDNKIIEECAQKMESCERVNQAKRNNRLRRLNPFNVDVESDHDDDDDVSVMHTTPVHVTENPLMQYLEQDVSKKEASKNATEPVNV